MEIAKNGNKYSSIPEGYDVEEWDEMTPYQRLKVKGLILEEKSTWMDYDKEADDTLLGLDSEETWLP